ncbi:MAG: tRNA pseudouridine synthase B [Candidatus Magasanikbacteria bacterium GW2011_GWD2_43_18]|uniref:tRNA pseudouridine synthase B n=1 Tax=Candidatus Magasanikbacteria bacterium GW2011_GWE2_42_7 TaxID=1619052 RepID=A0A0G1BCS6_9BACT|nr:MAG: tRNA pseudouridine synthase B [Candidatus Magasanikbacteria bacterium GW2011_GWC2_42_27]KKS70994.1 MAG: tRNA pseudouridine synthase B [Candidatus Magasanikbacteria bacterium GW2011_GWE2_42_7]KKT05278.1 MAG: tRNA pseudouridine synthase B [Candidatus Magasanikbacteria bacterium GW2011_GWD2_43_18]KKT26100.1 MAG: tRNA pseudouridine synthase B [Candidatus Magasanikbacteria bacterium GW2011_GWA2_43_9]HBB37613.1 tRNA pseudouridine(55) synthase TruB [Candidatus Magasanikbacteria bacterium]
MYMTGFLLIDKPVDWTSHDVVARVRGIVRNATKIEERKTKVGLPAAAQAKRRAKVGHAGTLDPFATGLLIVGIGKEATTQLDTFKGMKKEYIAKIRLGATSDTFDRTGVISEQRSMISDQTTEINVNAALESFIGKQQQLPPMYSAKKVGGKKLYELAREGIEIERQPCEIEIYEIALLDTKALTSPSFTIRIACSTGTYIRTLAHDIGQKLGTEAYCEELRRTKIGEYCVEDAVGIENLTVDNIHTFIRNIPKIL